MCEDARVILIYLPPYSPDLNPIEEFLAELKSFMKNYWSSCTDRSEEGFAPFLQWCVDQVGSRERSTARPTIGESPLRLGVLIEK